MIEHFTLITCDGCGDTLDYPFPNASMKEIKKYWQKYGWTKLSGGVLGALHYCKKCQEKDHHIILRNDMCG